MTKIDFPLDTNERIYVYDALATSSKYIRLTYSTESSYNFNKQNWDNINDQQHSLSHAQR